MNEGASSQTQSTEPAGQPFPLQGAEAELVGSTLGDLKIEALVHESRMSVVFRAEDKRLKRKVAVKFPRGGAVTSRAALARFEREGELAARASAHPSVVKVYSTGHHQGAPFLVLEWIEGESVWDRLQGPNRPERATLLGWFETLCEVVESAHRSGLVHRDLKPANVMIERGSDRVRLLDWGVAKFSDGSAPLTLDGTPMGTPGFMAPEQHLQSSEATPAADVYSLGMVLVWMLTSRLDPSAVEDAAVPPPLRPVLRLCLSHAPGQRPRDAGDLLKRFREARNGRTSSRIAAIALMLAGVLIFFVFLLLR